MNIKESLTIDTSIEHPKTEMEIMDGEYVEEVPAPSIEYTIEDEYTLCADGEDAEYERIKKDIEDSFNGVTCYDQTEHEENIFSNVEAAVASIHKTGNICHLCDRNCKSKSLLRQHLVNHPKMRICSYCSYTSYHINKVYDHINVTHKEHRRPYPCTCCAYQTYCSQDLRKHMKQQHTRRSTYSCPNCSYRTNIRTSLRSHIKAEHTKLVVYQCKACDYKAIRKNALNKHMKDKHTNACPFCDFASSNKLLLGNHVNSLHANFFYFTCSHCNYKTYYKKSLQEHTRVEHKENVSDVPKEVVVS